MSDSLTPNTIGIAPNGNIIVQGVELPEAPNQSLVATNSVEWIDSGGNVREWIQGFNGAPNHALQAVAQADANDIALIQMATQVAGSDSSVVATAKDSLSRTGTASIIVSDGTSSFPQLVNGPRQVFIDGGYGLVFTGVPANSTTPMNFTSARASWTSAIVLGAMSGATASPLTWTYGFTAPNIWTIFMTNNAAVPANVTWVGYVIGA